MALSGTTDFNLTVDEIIQEALENVGAVPEGDNPSTEANITARRSLNLLMRWLETKGVRLWKIEELVKKFTAASIVSNNSANYKCQLPHTSAAADEPGVGANSSKFWVITEDAANAGAWASSTAYTTPAAFDLDSSIIGIDRAFYRDVAGSDHPVNVTAYSNFTPIWDKDKTGTITHIALERKQSASRLHVYQPVNLLTDVLHYFAIKKLDDMDDGGQDADIYQRGLLMIVFGLSYNLTFKFPVDPITSDKLELRFKEALRDFKGQDLDEDDNDFIESSYSTYDHRRQGR